MSQTYFKRVYQMYLNHGSNLVHKRLFELKLFELIGPSQDPLVH